MAWACSYLKSGGIVENPKYGLWVLKQRGRTLTLPDVEKIKRDYKEAYKQRRTEHGSPEPQAHAGESETEAAWKSDLLKVIQAMAPDAFERLCKRILRESGFQRVETTGKAGDGGIDGHGELEVGLISFRVVFQAKRWKGIVGSPVVRDFRGAMAGRADKGLILTTGTFSTDARKEATRDGAPPIDLFDGDRLCGLLQRLGLGVSTVQYRKFASTDRSSKQFTNQSVI